MSETPDRPRTGMRPWLKALFALSLTLNLLVIGAIVGVRVGEFGPDRHPRSMHDRVRVDLALGPFARSLPEEARRDAMRMLDDRAGAHKLSRDALAQQFTDMLAILRSEPFDAEALGEIFDAQSDSARGRAVIGRDVLLEQIETMSDEERARYADRLERGFQRAMSRVQGDR